MDSVLKFLEFFNGIDKKVISPLHITIAAVVTVVIYLLIFLTKRFIQKQDVHFSITNFLIKFGIAFIVEFGLIWVYGPSVIVLSIVLGLIAALYVKNKLFSFIDTTSTADHDLKMRMELAELKNKFKKNPYYSILEVLLYYGYISVIQKEVVEAENIFKTPDDMARELLERPVLSEEQLNEAIGIMNVIRREGKILTREEALLLIMKLKNNGDKSSDTKSDEEEETGLKKTKLGIVGVY